MYGVGGFPEYLPWQQQFVDGVQDIARTNFVTFAYDHIHTPAVERNEILTAKGGDELSKEIFGLDRITNRLPLLHEIIKKINEFYETNQGTPQTNALEGFMDDLRQKYGGRNSCFADYGLHFDLTVPFARYVLDHQHELTFPFKRWQMQPVWRGERQQKGRFKEFVQADIDTIWSADTTRDNLYYDAETIIVLYKTFTDILRYLDIEPALTVRLSNKKLIVGLLEAYTEKQTQAIVRRIDGYYKMSRETFTEGVVERCEDKETAEKIGELIDTLPDDIDAVANLSDSDLFQQGIDELRTVTNHLDLLSQGLGVPLSYQLDAAIVRGLDYYTGTVFETFLDEFLDYGSVCSGGRYEDLTAHFETSQHFSGVGGSIGIDRFMSWVFDNEMVTKTSLPKKRYLLVHFEETFSDASILAGQLIDAGHQVALYPEPDKLKKQFSYANKAGFSHVVIFGEQEQADNCYKVKTLATGEEKKLQLKN